MEPFANHAFQPRAVVRRIDLAQAVGRLLARVAAANPARAQAWESARLKFADLAAGHLAYPAASVAVAAGVMKTAGRRQLSAVASGDRRRGRRGDRRASQALAGCRQATGQR